ncbi:urea amidohydrolase [Ochrobactrum teleogrylli]|uniref:Urea amidohydrolase n=2 Tax=Ochrobactrum teleogrylli TaxID=2479765 RepID=A0ABY2Y7S9_9HYPH|nr:urea amidohydrolase [[Ochrobactrum] teleogrylli]
MELLVKGVCFDSAAYVRYLYYGGKNITYNQLTTISALDWLPKFNFTGGPEWDGVSPLPKARAIGFYRIAESKIFHAAIAVDGTQIRATNGGALGMVWAQPVDLRRVLGNRNSDGSFNYDGTKIRVYYSNL